ncbi:2-oxoglutarate and iron-dependent oxygenase JMJD4 [Rhipicephalus sanguineus]|uniref:2-oxoglutarate and iron-dependent oxygenase JMJD4 n=1 Tax=Rhipicephalus sanguineus TaxID=34632 RepID=UPI0018947B43|nr:2-oxoglutarate and iron-dependent oxygenase JMJD4 [Rhipicephalus sanguineus]
MYSEFLSDRIERVKSQCASVSCCSTSHKCDEGGVFKVAYLCPDVSYREFFLQYASSNTPCILSPQHTSDWRSRREWVDNSGRPKLEFLKSSFGTATVPVSDCSVKQYDSPSCCEMTFSEYVDYWQKLIDSGHDYSANPCLYLKDWHFTRDFPTYGPYTTPKYFTSDWLNEYWDLRTDVKDDFRFVYMGPKGSWTPLHTDVFKSFSWSANICGRKLWYLFPPREGQVNNGKRNTLPCDVSTLLEESVKDAAEAQSLPKHEGNVPYLKVIQNPGEIIFVPSNWYHQVHNLDDTVSINHNFLNACNVKTVMINLMAALIDVQEEIAAFQDTDGFQEHCQAMLRAHFGMNVADFCAMLDAILRRRIRMFEVPPAQRDLAYRMKEALTTDMAAALFCHREILKWPAPILETACINKELMCHVRKDLEELNELDINFEHSLDVLQPALVM